MGTNDEIIEEEAPATFQLKSKNDHKRLLNHLIEKADVLVCVLDAREPLSFRSKELERQIKNNHKQLIYVLNKTDLVSK